MATTKGDTMSGDTEYNGWKNYPTWAVNMWLSNDEDIYEATREIVAECSGHTQSSSEYWTLAESHKYTTADAIKEFVTDDLAPDLGASFAADLLGYALDCVDWHEIASAWLSEVTTA